MHIGNKEKKKEWSTQVGNLFFLLLVKGMVLCHLMKNLGPRYRSLLLILTFVSVSHFLLIVMNKDGGSYEKNKYMNANFNH